MTLCDKHEKVKVEYETEHCPLCAVQIGSAAISEAAFNIGWAFVQTSLTTKVGLAGDSKDPRVLNLVSFVGAQLNKLFSKLREVGAMPEPSRLHLV